MELKKHYGRKNVTKIVTLLKLNKLYANRVKKREKEVLLIPKYICIIRT